MVARAEKKESSERARLCLNDGISKTQSVVGINRILALLDDGELELNGVLHVTKWSLNTTTRDGKEAKLLVLADGEVVEKVIESELGNPREMKSDGQFVNATAASSNNAPLSAVQAKVEAPKRVSVEPTPMPAKRPTMGGGVGTMGSAGILPISGLNPFQPKWKIRARAMRVEPIRKYQNAKGEGTILAIELADQTGAIKATGFKETADKFKDFFVEGRIYDISNCQVKSANKRFSSLNNEYELFMGPNTVAEYVDNDDNSIPTQSYAFVSLEKLNDKKKDDMIDVIGVLKSVAEPQELTSRAGKQLKKREVVLADDSKYTVNLTLWGQQAESFQGVEGNVLAVKGVRVGDFGGVSLSAVTSSQIALNPDMERTNELAGWWETNGSAGLESLSRSAGGSTGDQLMLVSVAQAANYGTHNPDGKPDYFTVRGTVMSVKGDSALYKACPEEGCKKRVIEQGDTYRCEKCNRDYEKFKWAAILQLELGDFSGHKWMTLFGDSCQALMGKTAEELGELHEAGGDAYLDLFNSLLFTTHYFRVAAKQETFNDQTSIKWRCMNVKSAEGEDDSYDAKFLDPALAKFQGIAV